MYIDLNMVRAGAVAHPEQWLECGYAEIQHSKARWRIIDEEQLMGFTGASSRAVLQQLCRLQVEVAPKASGAAEPLDGTLQWAVRSISKPPAAVGIKVKGREIVSVEGGRQLRN